MLFRPRIEIATERLLMRLPKKSDYAQWRAVREGSTQFLTPWEPKRAHDHLSRRAFRQRVYWSAKSTTQGRALPVFIFDRRSGGFYGAVTISNIRRGPAQMANLGYWVGQDFVRQGVMSEAVEALVHYAFTEMELSRIEAACLPQNQASRGLLEKCGFKYEGVAQAYLQIAGRWRTHVLYANIREDRRGKTEAE